MTGSIRVPVRGSFKGSMGFWGLRCWANVGT